MIQKFDTLVEGEGFSWKIEEILPKVLQSGERAGMLTQEGARLLDISGNLESGILLCPPEGDAGTGMVATNSVRKRTGNVSAGTSVFGMVVLEKELERVYPEIDLVTTPDGSLVGMVHANNCTWAPWNALAVGLTDSDTCNQVNMGNTTFSDTYGPVAEKMRALLDYAEKNPYAYGYNDACTAFARGESAMYPIGSYAIPQIKSVNPDMNIGSFTFPANDEESDNVLNSGIDLQFSVMKACKNKEAAYEVLKYLYEDETIQIYLDDQGGIACKDGDFAIPETLKDMRPYIENNRMADYQDHHYPSEMSVDAMIQTFLLDTSDNAQEKFLKKFDSDWKRYNRDLIRKVQDYQKEQEDAQ